MKTTKALLIGTIAGIITALLIGAAGPGNYFLGSYVGKFFGDGNGISNLNLSGYSIQFTTNNVTNPVVFFDSVCIPMGTFWSNNLASPASFEQISNSSDGFAFSSGTTQAIRTRFALPRDWDGGNIEVRTAVACSSAITAATGTNNLTNAVFYVKAGAIGQLDPLDTITFSSQQWITNGVSTNAYQNFYATSLAFAVGNSPTGDKSIVWEIGRNSASGNGDTETNKDLILGEVRLFFKRVTQQALP